MRKGIVWTLVCIMVAAVVSSGLVACGSKSSSDPSPAATTYSITGTITSSSIVLQGVTMTLSGASAATATTDASGNYTLTGLANGNYTITPSKTGYTFNPTSLAMSINGADITVQNFTATANTNTPQNVIAWFEDPGQTNKADIMGEAVAGTTSYNLYMSTDGTVYSNVTTTVVITQIQNMYVFRADSTQNSYFRTTAVVNGVETSPSTPVFLDYTNRNNMPSITITSPSNGQTNMSLTPTFTWTAYSGAAEYVILVEDATLSTWLLKKCTSTTTTWTYGSSTGISVTYSDTLSPLKANTQYSFIVWAIDSSGAKKAGPTHGITFTTQP
jgi:hypothetical protein